MEILEPQAESAIEKPQPRPPRASERRKKIIRQLRAGKIQSVDRAWLLAQFMELYVSKDIRAADKLRALELMAKISGYGGRTEEPEDEKAAIQDLINDMASEGKSG